MTQRRLKTVRKVVAGAALLVFVVGPMLAGTGRFMALSARLLPWLWTGATAIIAYGLWLAFFRAPPDYQSSPD